MATAQTRRSFLKIASATLATGALPGQGNPARQKPNAQDAVQLPPLHNVPTEGPEKSPSPTEPYSQRVGYAIVGLGDLALKEILPAFGASKYSKAVALVSGDKVKATRIAAQYGIKEASIYSYESYDELAKNPEVQVIYIVLPNSMHADFVVRGAKAGKHILCEKPMSTNVRDCERMISACNQANVKLMIAYRQQYEPMNRAIVKMVKEGKLGALKSFVATNAQNQGDPGQWRQKLALAGGGCLPDVGVYCLNAARFISGEEPTEVWGTTYQPKDDPRFTEVEETCSFTLKFPSGLIASCSTGYGAHRSQFLRMEGEKAWAELNPAFGYSGLKLRTAKLEDAQNVTIEPMIESVDQFAQEMDHMSVCVQQNLQPHTPGEEGLQDQRITDAIYKSAKTGNSVKLSPPAKPTRGPDPMES
ncbi:Gfo/Idh/MocA family protein [Granulicella arctica]|uniref:Gfo/Idh/MocA family protein n=1 Tax=Granulicella arctica TaxID=940613 RepID=UPI0021DFFB74|nr:Gfo/Idh/MocA family oxidoreductase [Granulicella arctica]